MATSPITFEAGNLNEFDATVIDSGDLDTHADAAMEGAVGMRATIDDTNAIYGTVTYANKTRLRIGFYFDPNGITMGDSQSFTICAGASGETDYHMDLTFEAPDLKLSVYVTTDGGSHTTAKLTISDAPHWIELDLKRSDGGDNGWIKFWVDTVDATGDIESTGLDDDTKDYDDITLGACAKLDSGTSGVIYFDQLTWNDTGAAIGPPAGGGTPIAAIAMNHSRRRS